MSQEPITTNLLGRRAYIDNQTPRRGERGEIVTVSHGAGGVLSIGLLYDDGHIEEYVASSNPRFHICPAQTPDLTRVAAHDLTPSSEPSLAQQLDRHQISVEHARAFYSARYNRPATDAEDAEVALVLSHHEPGAIPPAHEFLLPKEDEARTVALAAQLHRHQITADHARGFYKSRYPDNEATDEAVALLLSRREPGSIPPPSEVLLPTGAQGATAHEGSLNLAEQLRLHQLSVERARTLYANHYPGVDPTEPMLAAFLKDYDW